MGNWNQAPLESLRGKNITAIEADSDLIKLTCSDGSVFEMRHYQDCCESVHCLNPDDAYLLQDSMVLFASESNPEDEPLEYNEGSYTWTFFTIETSNGIHILKWFGTSNGYYSESVEFYEVKK